MHSVATFASQMPFGDVAPKAFEASFELTGRVDVLGISALDTTGRGCGLAIPCAERQLDPPRADELLVWERLAAHFGAALRLRRALASVDAGSGPEAVMSPSGRVEHAEGAAVSPAARETLREAALRFDRARTHRLRSQPLQVMELWRALVAGRWTLVDKFEADGRRFIVARPNQPPVDSLGTLTARETRVTLAAGLGHSNKMIAYELGIAPSTASGCLLRAAKKLGVATRMELIRLVAARIAGERPAPSTLDGS